MNTDKTDEFLWSLVRDNDQYAFAILLKKYYKQIHTYCCQYIARKDIAEEISSNVFITLWVKRASINIHTCFKSYVYSSAKNLSINFKLSKEGRLKFEPIDTGPIPEEDEGLFPLLELTDTGPDEMLSEMKKTLSEMIEKLTFQRKKILSFYLEGFKYDEMAQIMELSKKTVSTTVEQVVRKWRELLTPWNLNVIYTPDGHDVSIDNHSGHQC